MSAAVVAAFRHDLSFRMSRHMHMKCFPVFLPLALVFLLTACTGPAAPPAVDDAIASEAAEEPTAEPEAEDAADVPGFDIGTLPLSDAQLGDFPYFDPPPGYHTTDRLSSTTELAVFPFWTGDRYVAVEGRIHQANIRVDAGKTFSAREVQAYFDQTMEHAGAHRIHAGPVPREKSAEILTRDFTSAFSNGLCWPTEPVNTYVIRRTSHAIWVHACTYGDIGAAWVIAETPNVPEPAAAAVGSEVLRERIDADGRVDVAIHFESGTARMMSGSQHQIDDIVEMMENNPELALSVNGYTDNSGTAERNRALSLERAQAIVGELEKRGIARGRLRAHGFGRDRPIADNATPEGRARNRRVELERI